MRKSTGTVMSSHNGQQILPYIHFIDGPRLGILNQNADKEYHENIARKNVRINYLKSMHIAVLKCKPY